MLLFDDDFNRIVDIVNKNGLMVGNCNIYVFIIVFIL